MFSEDFANQVLADTKFLFYYGECHLPSESEFTHFLPYLLDTAR